MSTPPSAPDRFRRLLTLLGVLWLILAGAILSFQLGGPAAIEIEWVTETEFETAGFNIYRGDSPDGDFAQINERLIPSQGDPASGYTYTYRDRGVVPGRTYFYRLEEVELDNSRSSYDVGSGVDPVMETWATLLAAVSMIVGLFLLTLSRRQEHSVWKPARSQDLTQMSSGEY